MEIMRLGSRRLTREKIGREMVERERERVEKEWTGSTVSVKLAGEGAGNERVEAKELKEIVVKSIKVER